MFSLIVTIISVGLVVALAAVTMYYLSVSADKHAKEAAAAGLLTQSEQIIAAIDMRSVEATAPLTNLKQLPADNYLRNLPVPASGTYEPGLVATADDWWLLAPDVLPVVMLQNKLDAETCLNINRKLGIEGIKASPDPARRIQCFGDAAPYTLLLNSTSNAAKLTDSVTTWNKCVADPTSPGCTPPTTEPPPFCVANPTDASCRVTLVEPTLPTPLCVVDPQNALCKPTTPGKSFCELNPTHASCVTCATNPTDALCTPIVPPPQSFCELNPAYVSCLTVDCATNLTDALCTPIVPTTQSFCELNPTHTSCVAMDCVTNPTDALCKPIVPSGGGLAWLPSFCYLNPTHPSCTVPVTLTKPLTLCDMAPTDARCTTQPQTQPDGTVVVCTPIQVSDCHKRDVASGTCLVWDSTPAQTSLHMNPIQWGMVEADGTYVIKQRDVLFVSYSGSGVAEGIPYNCASTEPNLPFSVPATAKTLPTPEANGGKDACVPVVKQASGDYAIKSNCNASWCQNPIDGGSWIIYGTESTGHYGCKPKGTTEPLPLCTVDIAAAIIFAQPSLLINSTIAEWVNSAEIKWSTDLGWSSIYYNTPTWSYYSVGPAPYEGYTDINSAISAGVFSDLPLCGQDERLFVSPPWTSAPVNNIVVQCGTVEIYPLPTLSDFKNEIFEYGIFPENLLSSLPSDVCTPPNK